MASFIASELERFDIRPEWESPTNQLFYRFPDRVAAALHETYGLEYWEQGTESSLMRIVTSFSTTEEECRSLIEDVVRLSGR